MRSKSKTILRSIASLLLAALAVVAACNFKIYIGAFIDAYFAFTVIGATILYLAIFPKWTKAAYVGAIAAVLAVIDVGALHYPSTPMLWISFVGIAGFVGLVMQAFWSVGELRKKVFFAIALVVPSVCLGFLMPSFLQWTTQAHPKTLDLYVLSFDSSLRVQVSALVGVAFAKSFWLAFAATAFYKALPVPVAVVYAGRLRRSIRGAVEPLIAFLIAGPLGNTIYNIFPICGPRCLYGAAFPFHMLSLSDVHRVLLEPMAVGTARNGMPSLHFAWVLLAWWYSRKLSIWERFIALICVVFVTISIFGMGEHWVADAIVAFPFCVMVRAIAAYSLKLGDVRRLESLAFGACVVAGWLGVLRCAPGFFWISPVIPWALVAGTVALSIIQNAKLDSALDTAIENAVSCVTPENSSVGSLLTAAGAAR